MGKPAELGELPVLVYTPGEDDDLGSSWDEAVREAYAKGLEPRDFEEPDGTNIDGTEYYILVPVGTGVQWISST